MKRGFDEVSFDEVSNSSTGNANNGSVAGTSAGNSPSADMSQPPQSLIREPIAAAATSLKATISQLPRVPQISRKVRACSACKKQKIRCDFDSDIHATGEAAKCVRCRKMKLECVVNRSLQTILDEDVEWKLKMSEELAQVQRAVEDILKAKHMGPLSAYGSPGRQPVSASCSPNIGSAQLYNQSSPASIPALQTQHSFGKDSQTSALTANALAAQSPDRSGATARMPMTRENSPEVQNMRDPGRAAENKAGQRRMRPPMYDNYSSMHAASLSTNPMGSLYEVTRLRSLRSNSTANVHADTSVHGPIGSDHGDHDTAQGSTSHPSGTQRRVSVALENNNEDLVSLGLITLEEAEELFELFRSTLNHYLFDVALVHDNLTSVRTSSSILLASILTVASLHRPPKAPTADLSADSNNHNNTFHTCYQHFLTLVQSSMFDFPGGMPQWHQGGQAQSPYTRALDNIRALSIAAFWLPDLSWKLSGHAVRIATELNVHQSYRKALRSTPAGAKLTEAERMRREEERKFHYERARLWYLLYVCDHHFSIAYGRPPVICYSQHEAIRDEGYEKYLTSDLCKEGDYRVVSQMALFVVLERIYECFAGEISEGGLVREDVLFDDDESAENSDNEGDGNEHVLPGLHGNISNEHLDNISRSLKKRKLDHSRPSTGKKKTRGGKVAEFNKDLDDWRDNWRVRLRKNAFVGDYPAKGVLLHYHFAKLQLNSLALRGVTASATAGVTSADIISNFSPQRVAMARLAIESAKHVLTTILTVEEIRVCLIGVPLYVHTMIAFAAVFLMKVASRWRNVTSISDLVTPVEDVWKLVEKVVEVLRDVAGGGIREVIPEGKGKSRKSPMTEAPSLRAAGEMHIVWYIANGLEKMARKCRTVVAREQEEEEEARNHHHHQNQAQHRHNKWETVWQDADKHHANDAARTDAARTVLPNVRSLSDTPAIAPISNVLPPIVTKQEQEDYTPNTTWAIPAVAPSTSQPAYPPVTTAADGSQHLTYPYSSSAPPAASSDATHNMYFDQPTDQSPHQAHHHHHDTDMYNAAGSGLNGDPSMYTNLPLTPYEFFPTGATSMDPQGGGYFSFNGFDLFGGGTMEAIPMANAATPVIMRMESMSTQGGGYPGQYQGHHPGGGQR